MAEGAPLLREYMPKAYRGFESHRLRQWPRKYAPLGAFCFLPTNLPADWIARLLVSVPYYGDQAESNPI